MEVKHLKILRKSLPDQISWFLVQPSSNLHFFEAELREFLSLIPKAFKKLLPI
jgi:hypothetical protein